VTFPADYQPALAGKDAFSKSREGHQTPRSARVGRNVRQIAGIDTVDSLRQRAKESLQEQYARTARLSYERQLLDSGGHPFLCRAEGMSMRNSRHLASVEDAKKAGQLRPRMRARAKMNCGRLPQDCRTRVRLDTALRHRSKNNVTACRKNSARP